MKKKINEFTVGFPDQKRRNVTFALLKVFLLNSKSAKKH